MIRRLNVGLSCFYLLCVFQSSIAGVITNSPDDAKGIEGSKIQLVCIVQELEEGEVVSWLRGKDKISRGNAILPESSNTRYSMHVDVSNGHYFLVINPVEREDSESRFACGIYKNGVEIQTTDAIQILVTEIPKPKYPICKNEQRQYRSGEVVTFSCQSELVNPKPKLRWLTDENVQISDEEIQNDMITVSFKLNITPELDDKRFICNLKAADRFERNCTIGPIKVVYKPEIELNGDNLVKPENVYICSTVKANPTLTSYKWLFKPKISKDQYRIETGDQTLRLLKLYPTQNATVLECQVTNSVGTTTISMVLILPTYLQPPPSPSTVNTGQKSNNSKKMSSTKILSFVGSCLLLLACLMAVLLCVFVAHSRRYLPGVRVPQPDVYFMPKDSISTMGRNASQSAGVWKRSIGIQVPSDLDKESIYLEIGERKPLM